MDFVSQVLFQSQLVDKASIAIAAAEFANVQVQRASMAFQRLIAPEDTVTNLAVAVGRGYHVPPQVLLRGEVRSAISTNPVVKGKVMLGEALGLNKPPMAVVAVVGVMVPLCILMLSECLGMVECLGADLAGCHFLSCQNIKEENQVRYIEYELNLSSLRVSGL